MKAICVTPARGLEVRDIPTPERPPENHVIIKIDACAINHGDITFLKRQPLILSPRQNDVWGASGAGVIVGIGKGVPAHYAGKKVAVYRSLVSSPDGVGTWCEYSQLPLLNCAILPDKINTQDYCGSLVNIMTAYAFWKQAVTAGHKGILVTAGNSATGIAMLGVGIECGIPIVSIVRDQASKKHLEELSAQNILVHDDINFNTALAEMTQRFETTAVFDGIGGELINEISPHIPQSSTIYTYGFLGKDKNITMPTELLMYKDMTLKCFSNFNSSTVKNHESLESALDHISRIVEAPYFKTKLGKLFAFDQIDDALLYVATQGEKRIMVPELLPK